jgi:predicted nucleotidyltransferase
MASYMFVSLFLSMFLKANCVLEDDQDQLKHVIILLNKKNLVVLGQILTF